jgi:hypothetical protein
VQKDHLLTINGDKGTQSLYLRHCDVFGDITYKIPFTQRAGLIVAGGNHTVVTSKQVYSGVVGIETVRTILALSAMDSDLKEAMCGRYIQRFLIREEHRKDNDQSRV